jgi:TolB-like protein
MRFAVALAASLVALPSAAEDLEGVVERGAAELAAVLQRTPAVKRIALPPVAESGAAAGLGPTVEGLLATRLSKLAGVDVADRQKLGAVLGEQKLASMLGSGKGAPDPGLAERAGAQAVLAGQLSESGGKVLVQLRLSSAAGTVFHQFLGTADLPQRAARRGGEPEPIDVAMRRLADGLATGFAKMPGSTRYRRLAVLTFSETGAEAQKRKLGQIVTAEIATNLRRDHGFLLVERAKLADVLGELKLQQMIAPSSAQAGEIGKMADAQALVIGQVSEVGDRFLVNGRIVATESGETLAAESASVGAAGMVAFASDAVVLRSRSDALFRSLLLPGLGQFYNRQPAKAWLVIGAEAALIGGAVAYQLSASGAYADYQDVKPAPGTSPSAEAERLYDLAASRYRTRDVFLVAAGAVWVANAVDAWVSGVDGAQLLSGGPAKLAVVPVDRGAVAVASLRF